MITNRIRKMKPQPQPEQPRPKPKRSCSQSNNLSSKNSLNKPIKQPLRFSIFSPYQLYWSLLFIVYAKFQRKLLFMIKAEPEFFTSAYASLLSTLCKIAGQVLSRARKLDLGKLKHSGFLKPVNCFVYGVFNGALGQVQFTNGFSRIIIML